MKRGTIILILFFLQITIAQRNNVVEIRPIRMGDLKIAGFSINSEKNIKIEAEGAGEELLKRKRKINPMMDPSGMYAYGWILNAWNRKLVWRMTVDNTVREKGTRFNRRFSGTLTLPPGKYEVYFSAMSPHYGIINDGFFSLGRLLNKLLRGGDWFDEDEDRWFIRIDGVDEVLDRESLIKYHKARKAEAVVSITNLQNSDFRQEGFRLKKAGKFEIYAIGEGIEDEIFDYGWIIDASTSEKIWESLAEEGEYAGGALKNRMWKKTMVLKPGDYWVYFAMDDSHSPARWNANPPFDPDFYGITITGVSNEYDPESIEKLLKIEVKPIVELTRVGDNAYVSEGFKLNQAMRIRIYAIGEGRNGDMFDYGWIINTSTGEKVWEMSYDRTRHAGGARKNRLIDEVITLPAGSYMVYYRTDDSHSYEDWNAKYPYNPTNWGITIYPADPKYRGEEIERLKESLHEDNVISQITRVRDGQHIQKRFTLDKETRVRIYAIGEGDWDKMYDYGWIENEKDGQRIWEMTYSKTRWAGGARKNRLVDQIIMLDKGDYVLHFVTDNSHSYNDWNDDPPDDPIHYGITLYKKEIEK